MSIRVLTAGAVAGLSVCAWAATAAAAPSYAAFGRLPAVQSVAISPDGQAVAMVGGATDRRLLTISTIDQPNPVSIDLGSVRAYNVRWAGDGYILVEVTKHEKPSWSKFSYNFTRDLIIDRKGGLKGWLLNNSPETALLVNGRTVYKVIGGDKPVAFVRGLDSRVRGATNDTRFAENHDTTQSAIFKVDVATGKGSVVDRSEAWNWAFDNNGEARAKVDSANSAIVLSARGKGQSGWRTLSTAKDRALGLIGYSDPEDTLYWYQEDGENGATRYRKTNLADGTTTMIETSGPLDVTFDPHNGQAIGMVDDGAEKWTDAKLAAADAALSKAFKGRAVDLISWSADRGRIVVRVASPDQPASWYLFEPGRKELSPIGDEYPELKDAALGKKTFFRYAARDGLSIPAYLHMPPTGGKDLPLIVLPHGGPNANDGPGFDYEAQFLASRGYAVLQPQFRGSTGYGYALRKAGHQEWGGKMQTDLIDGINHLAKEGVIDPRRVCIVGASYGGYAALQSMTAFSDTYRCGVSVNGISDPGQMVVQEGRIFGNVNKSDMLQDLGSNAEEIARITPANFVTNVKGPILLVYSSQDTTVQPDQSKRMHEKLKASGKDSTLVEVAGDDHYMMSAASRIQMLGAVETFLAKNLPVTP